MLLEAELDSGGERPEEKQDGVDGGLTEPSWPVPRLERAEKAEEQAEKPGSAFTGVGLPLGKTGSIRSDLTRAGPALLFFASPRAARCVIPRGGSSIEGSRFRLTRLGSEYSLLTRAGSVFSGFTRTVPAVIPRGRTDVFEASLAVAGLAPEGFVAISNSVALAFPLALNEPSEPGELASRCPNQVRMSLPDAGELAALTTRLLEEASGATAPALFFPLLDEVEVGFV